MVLLKIDVRDDLCRFDASKHHSKVFKQESFAIAVKVF